VFINGVMYALTPSAGGQSLTVAGIPILNGVMNTIEVKGMTSASAIAATYTGTATFAAGVPEPAAWGLMIGGLALVGGAMRRQRNSLNLA
jgi:capsule polysaccharide export protein KpsC/LpsZ